MERIENFLFVEQSFTDIEKTKPAVINVNKIDNITCSNHDRLGEVVIIETEENKIIVKDENFFTKFKEITGVW